jgi:MYXO-CTERM domain-containing protein
LAPETLAALTAGFIPGSPADLPEPTGPALALAALAALAAARRAKR